ncbi:uncharacterized protein METZ01_LOCUS504280, partial [marine metagenome]
QEITETPLIPPSEKNRSPCVRDVHPGSEKSLLTLEFDRHVGVEMPVLHRDLIRPHPGVGAVDALAAFILEAPTMIGTHEARAPIDNLRPVVGTDVGKQFIALLVLNQEERIIAQLHGRRELLESGFKTQVHINRSQSEDSSYVTTNPWDVGSIPKPDVYLKADRLTGIPIRMIAPPTDTSRSHRSTY